MQAQEENRKEAKAPTLAETLALAERLAKHERFSPDWIHYPKWAGYTADIAPILERAEKFKEQARSILKGEFPPPAWLAEEDPNFRTPEPEQKANPEEESKQERKSVPVAKAEPKPDTPANPVPAAQRRRTPRTQSVIKTPPVRAPPTYARRSRPSCPP